MQSRPQAWLRQANNDLKLAQLARNNSFLAQACFFASQAAEKALKGALLELGQEPSPPFGCRAMHCWALLRLCHEAVGVPAFP